MRLTTLDMAERHTLWLRASRQCVRRPELGGAGIDPPPGPNGIAPGMTGCRPIASSSFAEDRPEDVEGASPGASKLLACPQRRYRIFVAAVAHAFGQDAVAG